MKRIATIQLRILSTVKKIYCYFWFYNIPLAGLLCIRQSAKNFISLMYFHLYNILGDSKDIPQPPFHPGKAS